MKIQILNKNVTNTTDYSTAQVYEVDEGAVLTLCKNETLDSATIRISNQTNQLELEPFDIVILSDFALINRKMCIDSWTETITCLNPKIYSYEIQLFSLTKILENYLLPNLKITKVWGETRYIDEYIDEYVGEYGPRIRIVSNNTYTWARRFPLSSNLIDKFETVECPEMQWNQPTLREVLNDLLMVKDCIVVINQDLEIDYMDLTEIGNDISENKGINYITSSQSSEDYVSELKVNLVNVTNPRDDEITNVVTKSEWHHISSDEDLVNSDNWHVETQYPIYKLKALKLFFYAKLPYNTETNTWLKVDLMNAELSTTATTAPKTINLVYEYKEWQTKNILYQLQTSVGVHVENYPSYKTHTLYYTRGGNKIQNFTNVAEKYIASSKQLITLIKEKSLYRYLYEQGISTTGDESVWPSNYCLNLFYIEYETLQDAVFKASKGIIPKHHREVMDNQTNSYVDSYNQGFLEYQKANRLGNLQLQINARYTDITNIIRLSDYYEDSIIYQIQYQFYNNHTEVNAIATKNYVLRNYFTGVKAKIRSWKIADGNEALTRHDLIKYYLEFSFNIKNESSGLPVGQNAENFLSPLVSDTEIAPVKYVAVRTTAGTPNIFPSSTEWYAIDLVSRLVGNSLVFTFGFQDNYWTNTAFNEDIIGSIDTVSSVLNISKISGGYPIRHYRYTDDNGENRGGEYYLLNGIAQNPGYDDITIEEEINASDIKNINFVLSTLYKPKVSNDAIVNHKQIYIPFTFIKDSQEITYISTQYELCSDTTDISFTKDFLRRQKWIRTIGNEHTFNIYTSNTYNFRNIELPDNVSLQSDYNIKITSSYSGRVGILRIETASTYSTYAGAKNAIELLKNKVVYITDEDYTLLMAINIGDRDGETYGSRGAYYGAYSIYLNTLRDRNTDVYDSQKNQIFKKSI